MAYIKCGNPDCQMRAWRWAGWQSGESLVKAAVCKECIKRLKSLSTPMVMLQRAV